MKYCHKQCKSNDCININLIVVVKSRIISISCVAYYCKYVDIMNYLNYYKCKQYLLDINNFVNKIFIIVPKIASLYFLQVITILNVIWI